MRTFYFFLLPLALLFLNHTGLPAQNRGTFDYFLGYGIYSTPWINSNTTDAYFVETKNPNVHSTLENKGSTGTFMIGYQVAVIDRLMLNFTLSYETITDDIYFQNFNIGNRKEDYYTVCAGANYNYISRPVFQMYSGFSAGLGYAKRTISPDVSFNIAPYGINAYGFAPHITAVGFHLGRRLGFFAEIGYGYKGIVSGGLFYRAIP